MNQKIEFNEIKKLFSYKHREVLLDVVYELLAGLLLEMKNKQESDVLTEYLSERAYDDGLDLENVHELDPKTFQQYSNEPELARRLKRIRKYYVKTTKGISKDLSSLALMMRNGNLLEK